MQINKIVVHCECLCGKKDNTYEVTPEVFDQVCMGAHYIFVSLKGDVMSLREKVDGCVECPPTSLE